MEQKKDRDHDAIVKFSVKQCEMCKKVDSILLIQKEQRDFCQNMTYNLVSQIGNKISIGKFLSVCTGIISITIILFGLLYNTHNTDIEILRNQIKNTTQQIEEPIIITKKIPHIELLQ